MLIEVKVDGSSIFNINCKNITDRNQNHKEDLFEYDCLYEKELIKNQLRFDRDQDIYKFVGKIIGQVLKKIEDLQEKEKKEIEEIIAKLFENEDIIAEYELLEKLTKLNIPNADDLSVFLPGLSAYADSKLCMFVFAEREFIYTTVDHIIKTYGDSNHWYSNYYGNPRDEDDIECFFEIILSKVKHFHPEEKDFIKKFKKIIRDFKKKQTL